MLGVEFSSNEHVFCQDGLLSVVHVEHNNLSHSESFLFYCCNFFACH
jgi:hypothetical protein